MPKPTQHQVNQAGEHLVAAELHRRGADAVMFTGNMPRIDILASNTAQTHAISTQVKAKTAGNWHAKTTDGQPRTQRSADDRFWVLVEIGKTPDFGPAYFVVPEW